MALLLLQWYGENRAARSDDRAQTQVGSGLLPFLRSSPSSAWSGTSRASWLRISCAPASIPSRSP